MSKHGISERTLSLCLTVGIALGLTPRSAGAVVGPSPGAVSPQTVKLPASPGSVRGLAENATVSSYTGQVQYTVPVELPKGAAGIVPSLALSYDGSIGNGSLGVGWTLSVAGIRRSLRLGVPTYGPADELELIGIGNGGQLVPIANGEYRVEGLGNSYTGRAVDGGFELIGPDGQVYRFGVTSAGRKASGTQVGFWYLEEVRDVAGQKIAYQHHQDRGEVYLDAITWGPTVAGGPAFRAELVYEPRTDAVVSYRTGFRVESAQRLKQIRIWSFGVVQRNVNLTYEESFALSRLRSVVVASSDGQDTLPPLTFTYGTPQTGGLTTVPDMGGWALNLQGTSLFDVDDDGAMDLLRLTTSGHSYRRNIGGRFGAPTPVGGAAGAALAQVRLLDLTGDSGAELVWQQGSQWSIFQLTGPDAANRTWTALGAWGGAQHVSLSSVAVADLNGDYRMDVVSASGSSIHVRFGSDSGLGTPVPKSAIDPTRTVVSPGNAATSFPDINGDGLADVVFLSSSSMFLYLGKGDGQFEKYIDVPYPWAGTIAISQIRLGDLDRDGLLDVAVVRAGDIAWYRGRTNGTLDPNVTLLNRPPGTDASVVVALADANGNGSEDVVWSSSAGMWILDFAGTTSAGMLTAIDNGIGQTQQFLYEASAQLAFEAADAGTPWTTTMPISIPVTVRSRYVLASGEPARSSRLDVRDGIYDRAERRFVGFAESLLTRPDPADGEAPHQTVRQIQRFATGLGGDRVLRGQVIYERVEDATGKVYRDTTNDVVALAVDGLASSDPRLRRAAVVRTLVRWFEGSATPVEIQTRYPHDGEGRVIEEATDGRLDLTGDESIRTYEYTTVDPVTKVRDQVCEEEVRGANGVLAGKTRRLFGDDLQVLALGQAGKGWVREEQGYLAEEDRWVTQRRTTYDPIGNPLSITTAGVERRFVYDADRLFPTEERLTAPSRELIWQASWDPVLAQVSTIIDPNGHSSHLSYDGVGRFTGVAIDGRPAHQVIEYEWVAPFPKTITWQFDGTLANVSAKPEVWSPDSHWRQTVEVSNGEGESRYHARRLSEAEWIISDYRERDSRARVVFVGRPVVSSQLELSARPVGIVGDTLAYDAVGRVTEQDLPTGASRTYDYDAFERTLHEVDLAPIHSVFDGQQRAIRTERSLPDGTNEIVVASYDPAGRLIQMTLGSRVTRSFTYDTLGRLIQAYDPDFGTRTLTWDDGDRLLSETNAAGQTAQYEYDVLGRLSTRDTGVVYQYHYDDARPGADRTLSNLAGRLAWIEEPTGGVDLGYDELGHTVFSRRRIDTRVSEVRATYATSGLMVERTYDDSVALTYSYDPAGRLVAIGDLWQLLDQDASGRSLHERTQNGVDTRHERDGLGLASRVTIRDIHGTAIYDASATRNDWAGITSITDLDGIGLDHSATFSYDAFARLSGATAGSGSAGFSFGYVYDDLHNMTSRTAAGPRPAGVFAGTYRYGEGGRAPRQLTSIADAAGHVVHTFDYDPAGRQVAQDDLVMTYDATDRLVNVAGLSSGPITHVFGQDGARVKTTSPEGSAAYFFGDGVADRNGMREHDVTVGDRVIARVSTPLDSETVATRGGPVTPALGAVLAGGPWALVLAVLCLPLLGVRRPLRRRAAAACLLGIIVTSSCNPLGTRNARDTLSSATQTVYVHTGFAAGPVLFTDSAGTLVEERRYEPFGEPIDARIPTASGDVVGDPDMDARDLNILNKRTDAATGWSDHGARWMAPETGRWLTPDPPVEGPDAGFMLAPWALQPYGYVDQNPIIYWDPSGTSTFDASTGTWQTDPGDTLETIAKETGLLPLALEMLNPELANSSSAGGQVISLPREPRIIAFEEAAKAIGDTDYAYAVKKGDFDVKTNKCNLFVNDIVEKTGTKFPKRTNFFGRESGPVTAGTLGDAKTKLSGLKIMADKDKAIGDVVSWKRTDFSDATGHTAIYAGTVGIIAKDKTVYRYPDGGTIGAGTNAINDRSMSYQVQQKNLNPVFRRIDK
jgi:RHS repeat-associated protein